MRDCTEIVCILDRSGSMDNMRDEAIGGFNAFVEEQRKVPGEAILSLVLFDNEYEMILSGVRLADVPPLTRETFVPRGVTALHDAIGRTINDVHGRRLAMPEAERPARVIVMIMTDGKENASQRFAGTREARRGERDQRPVIRDMIEEMTRDHSWVFTFIGANQDAVTTAASIGIPRGSSMNYDGASTGGTRAAYQAASHFYTQSRTGRAAVLPEKAEDRRDYGDRWSEISSAPGNPSPPAA